MSAMSRKARRSCIVGVECVYSHQIKSPTALLRICDLGGMSIAYLYRDQRVAQLLRLTPRIVGRRRLFKITLGDGPFRVVNLGWEGYSLIRRGVGVGRMCADSVRTILRMCGYFGSFPARGMRISVSPMRRSTRKVK